MSFRIVAVIAALGVVALGQRLVAAEPALPQRIASAHLPNALRVHPKVISGGLPEGDEAFAELARLGVRTVLSVDATKPDIATASRHGLRYVHLPHGYDGVPAERAAQLAKAVRDLEGPVYVHCHHGKHRSPVAAAVACVGAGLIDPASANGILQTAGTSPHYRGLYASAREAKRLDPVRLDLLSTDFPQTVDPPPMAAAMVAMEHTHDHLKAIAAARWRAPADHPDLDPAHEALLLREHFTELLRTDEAKSEPEAFRRLLAEGEANALALEETLREAPVFKASADAIFGRVGANCVQCHTRFRDVPLGEK